MSADVRVLKAALALLRSRPGEEFDAASAGREVGMPARLVGEALSQLVVDGHAATRRARTKLYVLDPADARPALPDGYRYSRAVQPVTGQAFFWVVTPRWSARGGAVWLLFDGESSVSHDALWDLTTVYQPGGAKPLSAKEAHAWIASLPRGLAFDGGRLVAPIADVVRLDALAQLASDFTYWGAGVAAAGTAPGRWPS